MTAKHDDRWTYMPLEWENEDTPEQKRTNRLAAELPDDWKLVAMDARLYTAFTAAAYKGEQFLLDVLEALATPDATTARLVVERADIVLATETKPAKRPRRL